MKKLLRRGCSVRTLVALLPSLLCASDALATVRIHTDADPALAVLLSVVGTVALTVAVALFMRKR